MSVPTLPPDTDSVSFGPFRLFASERRLEQNGVRIVVGSRAFDLLTLLVQKAGRVVTHRELIAHVWRDVIVEESSLRVNLAGLRRTLGDGMDGARYIANIPGQGYCFVAPLTSPTAAGADGGDAGPRAAPVYPLPGQLVRMIGRNDEIDSLGRQLISERFVSIVGPGGMGKTTIAIAIAHGLLARFENAVCFFDLAPLTSPDLLASTMAATLGLAATAGDAVENLLAGMPGNEILLVLDSCEHLIDAVAALTERLFRAAPQIFILATSREPLRVEGEKTYRLAPLASPPPSATLTAAQAIAYPAVALFVDRAEANGGDFQFGDDDAAAVAEICRKLDGIALAIELGAGRVAAFGVQGTARLLDNRFRLSWQGRRTALPRHQTLHAMLDWSHQLLPEFERTVLRRLAVFTGAFSLDAAVEVIADSGAADILVIDAIASLVAKSLASAYFGDAQTHYRLLDSARVYAAEKLQQHGESDRFALRRAAYLAALFESSYAGLSAFPPFGTSSHHLARLGDLRASLTWCFSPAGDKAAGVRLVAAAAPLLLEFSLLQECSLWCERALAHLDAGDAGGARELVLLESWATASMFASGNSDDVRKAIERGLELARRLGNLSHELRLLAGLNVLHTRISGVFPETMPIVERSIAIARQLDDPAALAMAEWMHGVACHRFADLPGALLHCENGMALIANVRQANTIFFGYDHRTRAEIVLARTLWLAGKPDQAAAVAWQAMAHAERIGHPTSVCIALVYAPTVMTWNGDWDTAERLFDKLVAHAGKHMLGPYRAVGIGLKGEALVRRGEANAGVALLYECLDLLRKGHHQTFHTVFVSALASGLAALGRFGEALAALSPIIPGDMATFDAPEILRIQGELLATMPRPDHAQAEQYLRRSLEGARHQGSLGWELRAATTLARLRIAAGAPTEAAALLETILPRFTEGHNTDDYRTAMRLSDSLRVD